MDANQTQVYACHKTPHQIKVVDFEFILNVTLHKIDTYLDAFESRISFYFSTRSFVLAEIKTC